MYLRQKEHNPPHIHAICGDTIGMFSLSDGEMFEGDKKFIDRYGKELLEMWNTNKFTQLKPVE